MEDDLYREMDSLENHFWWFVARRKVILHLIQRFLDEGDVRERVACDIGCGCGALLAELDKFMKTIGVDRSSTARSFCEQKGLEVIAGALPDDVPCSDNSCDVVILSDVLEHIDEDRQAVERVVDILRPGGLLVCTVPAYPWLWTRRDEFHHHFRRYRYDQFAALFADLPLKAEIFSYYNTILFPLMLTGRLLRKAAGSDRAEADLSVPPSWINAGLRSCFEAEKHLLPHCSMPFGGSLISVHRKQSSPPVGSGGISLSNRGLAKTTDGC